MTPSLVPFPAHVLAPPPQHFCPQVPNRPCVPHPEALCSLLLGLPILLLTLASVPCLPGPQPLGLGHTAFGRSVRLELAKRSVGEQRTHLRGRTDSLEVAKSLNTFLVKAAHQDTRQSCQDPQRHHRGAAGSRRPHLSLCTAHCFLYQRPLTQFKTQCEPCA